MPMLPGLGGRHVNDLTGTAFEHDEAILPQRGALHGVSCRSPGVRSGEIIVGHDGTTGCSVRQTGNNIKGCAINHPQEKAEHL